MISFLRTLPVWLLLALSACNMDNSNNGARYQSATLHTSSEDIRRNDSVTIYVEEGEERPDVSYYVWNVNHSGFQDTTSTGEHVVVFHSAGEHIVEVKTLDKSGDEQLMEPLKLMVQQPKRAQTAGDSLVLNAGDTIALVLSQAEHEVAAEFFLWSLDFSEQTDSTETPEYLLGIPEETSGRHVLYLRKLFYTGEISQADSIVLQILPRLWELHGTENNSPKAGDNIRLEVQSDFPPAPGVFFRWSSPSLALDTATSNPTLELFWKDDLVGKHEIQVRMTDSIGREGPLATLKLNLQYSRPKVERLPDLFLLIGDSVKLEMPAKDEDGELISWNWTFVSLDSTRLGRTPACVRDTATCVLGVSLPDTGFWMVNMSAIDDDSLSSEISSFSLEIRDERPAVLLPIHDTAIVLQGRLQLELELKQSFSGNVVFQIKKPEENWKKLDSSTLQIEIPAKQDKELHVRVRALTASGFAGPEDTLRIRLLNNEPIVNAGPDQKLSSDDTLRITPQGQTYNSSIETWFFSPCGAPWLDSSKTPEFFVRSSQDPQVDYCIIAKDKQGRLGTDTLRVEWDFPPTGGSLYLSDTTASAWENFGKGKGDLSVFLDLRDAESPPDSLQIALWITPEGTATSLIYSGSAVRKLVLSDLPASKNFDWQMIVHDPLGGQSIFIGSFRTPSPPRSGRFWSRESSTSPLPSFDGKSSLHVFSGAGIVRVTGSVYYTYPSYRTQTESWESEDGRNWSKRSVAAKVPVCPESDGRETHWKHADKSWIFNCSGVWSSPDGLDWTHMGDGPAAGKRQAERLVAFSLQEKMWILRWRTEGKKAEIWWSSTGKTWNFRGTITLDQAPLTGVPVFVLPGKKSVTLIVPTALSANHAKSSGKALLYSSSNGKIWSRLPEKADLPALRAGDPVILFQLGDTYWLAGSFYHAAPLYEYRQESWSSK